MMATPAVQPIAPTDSPTFFSDTFWKRFQTNEQLAQHVPVLALDGEGTICSVSRAARSMLEYGSDQKIEPYFFTHVHGRNLRRVMQDLAHMACNRKSHARWLVRLQTGTRRWRWYRITVLNRLEAEEGRIFLRLERI
jgi:PAS domain-containing protein